jgi:hypothetical protein
MKSRLRRIAEEDVKLRGRPNFQPDTKKFSSHKNTKPGAFSPGFFMPVVDKRSVRLYYKQAVVDVETKES